jgi:RNA polymerase sigma factor (sigma-70 family)
MKNYTNSDFAVNKFSNGIVYRFATGAVEITLEDYLRENPGMTEADFAELKALSDEMYEEQSRDENRQTYRNVSFHDLEEIEICSTSSPEHEIIDKPEEAAKKKQRRELGLQALDKLTEVQRRRYLMYHVDGLKLEEIAEIEGVAFQSIAESLEAAKKKINKFLQNH